MTFSECVTYAAGVPGLVSEFNRLTGSNLGRSARRTGLDRLIDEQCGYSGETDADMTAFTAFVYECVWLRVPGIEGTEADHV